MNGLYLVSFAIHTRCLSELSLQPTDLLLELISFMFTFNGLLLQNEEQIMLRSCVTCIEQPD